MLAKTILVFKTDAVFWGKLFRMITFGTVKKIIQSVSVFMAVTILLQSAFCWLIVFCLWNQNLHFQKEKIEKNIPVEKLTAINLKQNKKAIKRNSKEIEFNGEWFDIVYKTGEGDCEIFYCISDKKETEIMLSLERQKDNSGQLGLVSFMKSLSKEYPPVFITVALSKNNFQKIYNSESVKKILSGYQTILYSPPDFEA